MEIILTIIFVALVAVVTTLVCVYRPWQALVAFGMFLLLQDIVISFFSDEIIRQAIKYFDEIFIWFFLGISMIRAKNPVVLPSDYLIVGALMVGLISSYLNAVPIMITVSDVVLMFKFYALFRSVVFWGISIEVLEKIGNIVVTTGGIVFVVSVVEILFPAELKGLIWREDLSRVFIDERGGIISPSTIFIHPGVFGWFCSVAAIVVFGKYLQLKDKKLLMLFVIFLVGIIFSGRRKPLFGMVIAIVTSLMFVKNRFQALSFSVIAIFIIIGAVFTWVFFDLLSSQVSSALLVYFREESFETQARNILYLFSGIIAIDYFPFGVGFGQYGGFISFKYYSNVYYEYGLNKVWGLAGDNPEASFGMDTYWPYVLGELGFIGLVLFMVAMYMIWRPVKIFLKRETTSAHYFLAFIVTVIFIESLLESIASPVYGTTLTIYFIFVPMGIMVNRILFPDKESVSA